MIYNLDCIKNIELYILLFFTYSFAGWFMESIGGILKVKKFVNRGFLIGPYCPVYGYGVVLITLLLNGFKENVVLLFCLSILICGTLEYLTSFFMEKLFNARWWDYHNKKFNLNGRICLETVIPFGLGGTIIIYYFNPLFNNLYSCIPDFYRFIITVLLTFFYILDTIISFIIIYSFKGQIYRERDNTEEISAKVKDKTEDFIMKAESDAIVFSRKLKLSSIRFSRKVKYTRKILTDGIIYSPRELAEMINAKKQEFNEKLNESRERIGNQIENIQKQSKEKMNNTINNIKLSSEEFSKQVINSFREKSFLRKRLTDAFPSLQVIPKVKKDKNKK